VEVAYFEGTPPRVIAHRGLALDCAENTLSAFRAAVDAGADLLETDVHLSKDGVVVVAHDPDLARVAGRPGLVSDFTAQELHSMDLGYGEGFPTLVEVLEALPREKFNIDLKIPSVVDAFVDVVTQTGARDRILVASFDESTREQAVARLPGVVSSATAGHIVQGRLRSWLGLPTAGWSLPPEVKALQIPPTHFGLALVTPSLLRMAHARGLEVHVWTINEPTQMKRLLEMGVDGIVTDRCDLARAIVDGVATP
jgi:glycerophosphoryl diester phosphodiesterase